MRVYLQLLHLPVMDLRQAVEDAMEENPMLEEVSSSRETGEYEAASPAIPKNAEEEADETLHDGWMTKNPLTFANNLRDLSRRKPEDARRIKDFQETLITKPESLFDYLEWQVHFLDLDKTQEKIVPEIIGNIDPDGYLKASIEEIANAAGSSPTAVEETLRKIQQLDPPGIGARDIREALLIQLEHKGPDAVLAREIVRDHMDLLAKRDWKTLARIYSASPPDIKRAADIVARLEPRPGRSFYVEEAIAITPDATVSLKEGTDGGLEIEVHHDYIPEIRINPEYRQMMREKGLDEKTKEFLKTRLASGMELLKAIDLRKSTLRAITDEIVRAQPLFFTRGFSHLRPLRLKDIAERVNLHESTVSRAIHGKYLKTPQGTIPYKSFFSQKVGTEEGPEESQKSIMEKIRALIEKEDPQQPLSDAAIVERLKDEDIALARRTAAKYREMLKILPSHLRRKR